MQRHLNEAPVPLRTLAPQTSEAFCLLVEAMMEKTAANRIDSAQEVIRRLRRWTPATPLPLPRQGPRMAAAASGAAATWLSHLRLPRRMPRQHGMELETIADAGPPLGRVAGAVRRVLVPSLGAGGAFWGVIALIRTLGPTRFDDVFRPFTPGSFGMAAFLLMFLLQVVTLLMERSEQ